MRYPEKLKGVVSIAVLASALIFIGAGCGGGRQTAALSETKPPVPAAPVEEKIEPLKLVYALSNFFGPRSESDASF